MTIILIIIISVIIPAFLVIMDSEKATPSVVLRQEKKNRNCCFKVSVAVALVLSIVACALSVATFAIQILNMKQNDAHILPSHYTPQQEKQLMHEVRLIIIFI